MLACFFFSFFFLLGKGEGFILERELLTSGEMFGILNFGVFICLFTLGYFVLFVLLFVLILWVKRNIF